MKESVISDKKTEAQQNKEDALWTKIMENVTQIKEFPEDAVKQEVKNVKIENKEMAEYFGMSEVTLLSSIMICQSKNMPKILLRDSACRTC